MNSTLEVRGSRVIFLEPGIADPEDLEALQEILAEFCGRRSISVTSAEAQEAALHLVLLFNSGMRDRDAMLSLLDPEDSRVAGGGNRSA